MPITDEFVAYNLNDPGPGFYLVLGGLREASGARHGVVVIKRVTNSKITSVPFSWHPARGFAPGAKATGRLISLHPELPATINDILGTLEFHRRQELGDRAYVHKAARPPHDRR
jgi:hypothetical protein